MSEAGSHQSNQIELTKAPKSAQKKKKMSSMLYEENSAGMFACGCAKMYSSYRQLYMHVLEKHGGIFTDATRIEINSCRIMLDSHEDKRGIRTSHIRYEKTKDSKQHQHNEIEISYFMSRFERSETRSSNLVSQKQNRSVNFNSSLKMTEELIKAAQITDNEYFTTLKCLETNLTNHHNCLLVRDEDPLRWANSSFLDEISHHTKNEMVFSELAFLVACLEVYLRKIAYSQSAENLSKAQASPLPVDRSEGVQSSEKKAPNPKKRGAIPEPRQQVLLQPSNDLQLLPQPKSVAGASLEHHIEYFLLQEFPAIHDRMPQ